MEDKWQDKVITIINLSFGFMLIPMILDSIHGDSVNVISSFATMTGLYVLAYCFWTLKLKFSFLSDLFAGSMWLILFISGILK